MLYFNIERIFLSLKENLIDNNNNNIFEAYFFIQEMIFNHIIRIDDKK